MAQHVSAWEFVDLPDGRTLQDARWSPDRFGDQPRDAWLAAKSGRVAGFHVTLFASIFAAVVYITAPAGLPALAVGIASAVATVVLSDRTDLSRIADTMGTAWLYIASPPSRAEADARIAAVLGACGFTKVRHEHQAMASITTGPRMWPDTTTMPTYACIWYGDAAVMIVLHGHGPVALRAKPPIDPYRPHSLQLETRGRPNIGLHRRLKVQLLQAFVDRIDPRDPPWIPPPEKRPEPLDE